MKINKPSRTCLCSSQIYLWCRIPTHGNAVFILKDQIDGARNRWREGGLLLKVLSSLKLKNETSSHANCMTALFCYSTILTTSTAVYQSKNVSDPTTCVGKENERKTTCLLVHCLLDGLRDTQNQTSITANTVYLHQLCKTRNQRLLGLGFANLENKAVPNWGSCSYMLEISGWLAGFISE